jgi:hypothetical protein
MSKSNESELLREMAEDLDALGRVLSHKSICRDSGPLYKAASACRASKGKSSWAYDLQLVFEAFPGRHPMPENLDMLEVQMLVDVEGHFTDADIPVDPFSSLVFELIIHGTVSTGARKYRCSWHLDRHVDNGGKLSTSSDEEEEDPDEVHPRYHVHFGGRRMQGGDYGDAIIVDVPRLAHPPLDAILGVDFVLANFRGNEWRKLMQDDAQYQSLLKNSQRRAWRPYVIALESCWKTSAPAVGAWSPQDVWPSLLMTSTGSTSNVEPPANHSQKGKRSNPSRR